MTFPQPLRMATIFALCAVLAACSQNRSAPRVVLGPPGADAPVENNNRDSAPTNYDRSSVWDLFGPRQGDQTVKVNRYIWAATLDVLNFLPVEQVDPFTGIIVTGYGTPPGGGRAYRATVHIKDPALEARSLNVALQSRNGPVSPATNRAIEDAILSRARQLRISDDAL